MTLFTNMEALSYDVVVHVLDGFLIAGWKQIFRVALVILEALQVRHSLDSTLLRRLGIQDSRQGVMYTRRVISLQAFLKRSRKCFTTSRAMR